MDGPRFDDLTRTLADRLPRRRLLRALTGGTAGLLVGAARVGHARAEDDAAQFCRQLPPGERGKCRADVAVGNPDGLFARCEGVQNRLCASPDGSVSCCTPPQTCGGGGTPGACGCTPTKTTCAPGECGGFPDGCGGTVECDPCPACQTCDQGTCRPACGATEGCCGGQCVDFATDPANCGACGNACTDGRICVEGDCCQASVGGPCDPNSCCTTGLCGGGFCRYSDPGEPCDEDSDCASFRCDEARGRCSLLSPFGGPCESDFDCAVDGLACLGGACGLPPICRSGIGNCAALGESCASLPCCSGTCAGGVCACIQAGQGCRDQYDCCFGSVCWEGVCRITEGVGDSCASDADCDPGAFCSSIAKVCLRCESGDAGFGPHVVEDCPWPMPGFACGPDPATGHPGFGYCCVPGENCAGDPCARPCNPALTAQAGSAICPPLTLP